MELAFEKWHGCLNDFIVTWLSAHDEHVFESLIRQAQNLCSRNGGGIGADGIIVLHATKRHDLIPEKVSIINSDGSLAKTCGNGIRCAALSVYRRHKQPGVSHDFPEGLVFKLEQNIVALRFIACKRSKWPYVAVEMGIPTLNEELSWHEGFSLEAKKFFPHAQDVWTCSLPNPHVVVTLPVLDRSTLLTAGPALQKTPPLLGINLHLVEPVAPDEELQNLAHELFGQGIEDAYKALSWERGAGETAACGSGACAIATCAFDSGAASRGSWVAIKMPGGTLFVKQNEVDDPVTLVGPAEFVFEGLLDI